MYQFLFKMVTHKTINFGNYTMISRRVLDSAVGRSIHYSAFLSKLRFTSVKVKHDRRKRLDGKSKMNYQSLAMHGLSSLIEYADYLLHFFIRLFLVSLFNTSQLWYIPSIFQIYRPGSNLRMGQFAWRLSFKCQSYYFRYYCIRTSAAQLERA